MEEKKIIINDKVLSYLLASYASSRIPVVFLHGWRSRGSIWLETMHHFASLKRSLYALDLPGFGSSQGPKDSYSVLQYADIVSQFFQIHKIKKAHIVGHSFGGRIAIKLASKNPDSVQSLILVDSAGIRKPSVKRSLITFGARLTKPLFGLHALSAIRSKIYSQLGADDYIETPELQKTYLRVISEDLSPDLSKIIVPTLLYWGRDDKETPLSMGEQMHELIKKSEFVIDDGGHFAFVQNSVKFASVLEEFITKHD